MLNEFFRFFNVKEKCLKRIQLASKDIGFREVMENYGGMSFGKGMYRLLLCNDIPIWNRVIEAAFPQFEGNIKCFGFDWLGRIFALDIKNNSVLMFEPGTGDILSLNCDFTTFHEEEIPHYHEACFASQFFAEWNKHYHKELDYKQCVGYKVPLFLNGDDTIDNLEVSDMDVYWHVCTSLLKRIG